MSMCERSSDVCSSDLVAAMREGLRVFLERTQGQSPVMRSAVAAFGFVYIHPLADGNGRVHRFLINDILRRDGAVPEPVILPVSAVITDDSGERRSYDLVLDEVSKPLMQAAREHIRSEEHTSELQSLMRISYAVFCLKKKK